MEVPARQHGLAVFAVAAVGVLATPPTPALAQAKTQAAQTPSATHRVGVQGFGMVGMNWLVATESLEATGLETKPVELGGGVQITNIWRDLFAQVDAGRTSSTGERVFVDDAGTSFPLGIPLSVKATYIDVSVGWKSVVPESETTRPILAYIGGGLGMVRYSEESPFAQPDDDLKTSSTSYHVLVGVEVRLLKWLGVSAEVRYRYVPNVLGTGGVSAALGEDNFGGVNAGVGMRVILGGAIPVLTDRPTSEPAPTVPLFPDRRVELNAGVIIDSAPVFLRADATMEPLRILEPGTSVRILSESDDWVRIQFTDRLLGPRVGYVERKHIRLPKLEPPVE